VSGFEELVQPRIEVIGVRSSCETVARNSSSSDWRLRPRRVLLFQREEFGALALTVSLLGDVVKD